MKPLRLGVNIDHVATVRNARGGDNPDPVRAARLAQKAGADGITAHLREDRRHISDDDIARLSRELEIPLNLEMAATGEMLEIAIKARPHAACIVPEQDCCGLPLQSNGNFPAARTYVRRLVDRLAPHAHAGLPIIANSTRADRWARRWWNCIPAPMPMPAAKTAKRCFTRFARRLRTAPPSGLRFMPVMVSPSTMSNPSPCCRKSASSISATS